MTRSSCSADTASIPFFTALLDPLDLNGNTATPLGDVYRPKQGVTTDRFRCPYPSPFGHAVSDQRLFATR